MKYKNVFVQSVFGIIFLFAIGLIFFNFGEAFFNGWAACIINWILIFLFSVGLYKVGVNILKEVETKNEAEREQVGKNNSGIERAKDGEQSNDCEYIKNEHSGSESSDEDGEESSDL